MTLENKSGDTRQSEKTLEFARKAMTAEASAIQAAARGLGEDFVNTVQAIFNLRGKVAVTGLGKSGHVARKLAATLASTGTPSFFLHPSEALHGDLGMLSGNDLIVAIAFGGETAEVVEVARHAKRIGCFVASITGKKASSLGLLSDSIIDGSIDREVCPLNLAPTASTAVAMSLGDALAVALMEIRGFSKVDFAALHPGGSLGRKLSTVADHMRKIETELFVVPAEADFHQVLSAVTKMNFGIAPVVDKGGLLVGAISDGDIRRALQKEGAKALGKNAGEIMTPSPRTIGAHVLALEALGLMEKNQITSLFVLKSETPQTLCGIVRMHDLLTAKIV